MTTYEIGDAGVRAAGSISRGVVDQVLCRFVFKIFVF
jgi:hypothetical protein